MTAEEFYKDHFGHTSQHVSMDKILVCMELYARYQKGFYCDECKGTSPTSNCCENPSCPNMPCCGHTTTCDCEPEIK